MFITSPLNLKEAKLLKDYCDGYLVGLANYIPSFLSPFSYEDFLKLLDLDKLIILRLDVLVREKEIEDYEKLIIKLKDLNILYYITDLGILNILKKQGLINKTIYDPFTMICNYLDAKTYYNLGLDAISPSLEIPYKDILKIDVPLFYLGFGRRLMFNSKRNLLSLYKEEKNLSFSLDNLTIIEEKRTDSFPIFEDMGTYIYRSYYLNNLEFAKNNSNIKYLYVEHLTIDSKTYLKLIELIKLYLKDDNYLETLNNYLITNNLNVSEGFNYQDSIYQKEEIINEKN